MLYEKQFSDVQAHSSFIEYPWMRIIIVTLCTPHVHLPIFSSPGRIPCCQRCAQSSNSAHPDGPPFHVMD